MLGKKLLTQASEKQWTLSNRAMLWGRGRRLLDQDPLLSANLPSCLFLLFSCLFNLLEIFSRRLNQIQAPQKDAWNTGFILLFLIAQVSRVARSIRISLFKYIFGWLNESVKCDTRCLPYKAESLYKPHQPWHIAKKHYIQTYRETKMTKAIMASAIHV